MSSNISEHHHRRTIRLKGYDYTSPGAYFVTLCTHQRFCLLGEVADGAVRLSSAGEKAAECWQAIPQHFPHVALDAFVVMPNHVHGILLLGDGDVAGAKNFSPLPGDHTPFRSPEKTVGSIVRGFKIGVTTWMRANSDHYEVWQRNYFERIVRGAEDLNRIRQYIAENPQRWVEDADNPDHVAATYGGE